MRGTALVVVVLAACAAAPNDDVAPVPAARESEAGRSLVPGTIHALVAPAEGGVRVEALAADGPAARAGLRVGDLIVRCEREPVGTVRGFNQQVLESRPGDRLRLDVRRDQRMLNLQIDVMQLRTAVRV